MFMSEDEARRPAADDGESINEVTEAVDDMDFSLQLQSLWIIPTAAVSQHDLTAAIPVDNPCCSCKPTRTRARHVRR